MFFTIKNQKEMVKKREKILFYLYYLYYFLLRIIFYSQTENLLKQRKSVSLKSFKPTFFPSPRRGRLLRWFKDVSEEMNLVLMSFWSQLLLSGLTEGHFVNSVPVRVWGDADKLRPSLVTCGFRITEFVLLSAASFEFILHKILLLVFVFRVFWSIWYHISSCD